MDKSTIRYNEKDIKVYYPMEVNDIIINKLKKFKLLDNRLSKIYHKYIQKDDLVIDCGSYIGTHTFIIREIIGESGNIIALEPQNFIVDCLKKSIRENNYVNIDIINKCCGVDEDTCDFYETNGSKASMKYIKPRLHRKKLCKKETISIDTILKTYLNHNLNKNLFIKIDIDGGELLVLQGAIECVKKYKPIILINMDDDTILNTWCNSVGYKKTHIVSNFYLLSFI
tara:strand:+ start:2721 stop:3401 length:681 start_codon:yes stop_codon:yes gene_type:complete